MNFYIVDAFTTTPFGGNTAGVIIVPKGKDFPSESTMLKTANELRYSETVFVKHVNEKNYHLRYFTPTDEVDLCGHATIAAFKVISQLTQDVDTTYDLTCLAGNLKVKLTDDYAYIQMQKGDHNAELKDQKALQKLSSIMGLHIKYPVTHKHTMLMPALYTAGLTDIMMPVQSKDDLMSISPDFKALAQFSKDQNAVGVHAFFIDEDCIYCRNFAPLYGINEEAATGTSNGALTYYLNDHHLAKNKNIFIQGESMHRPSEIISLIDDEHTVWIGGNAVILAEGIINFSPLV